jgi:hypothetical protein
MRKEYGMKSAQTAFLILLIAVGSLASASPEQTSEQPVAEVLGKPIYQEDVGPPTPTHQQQGKAISIDEEERLKHDREQLRGLVWGSVFRDYAASRKVKATEAEVESLYLSTFARVENEVEAKRESISERKKEIARYQEELGDPEIPAERKRNSE